jgi:geranylgeranyl diphosphate synthase type II
MKYSVVNSGKRIRPVLCMLGARFAGKNEEKVMTFAIAAELIHSYSLVHDDLPAVDNDAMRRGKLSTHVMHGEAMGIFAGDALLNLAYEIMIESAVKTTDFKRLHAMEIITKAVGAGGLLNGQAKDVDYDNCESYLWEHIIAMYRNKTADLIRASLVAGALIGGAEREELEALSSYGDSLGIYFQLQDDLMDEGAEKIDMNMSIDCYSDSQNEENSDEDDGIEPHSQDVEPCGNPDAADARETYANAPDIRKESGFLNAERARESVGAASAQNRSETPGGRGFPNASQDGAGGGGTGTDKTESGENALKIDSKKLLGLDKTADELLFDEGLKTDGKALLKSGGEQTLGIFKSAKKEKMTFLKAAGEEETKKLMVKYEEYVRETMIPYGDRADELLGMIEFIKKRGN